MEFAEQVAKTVMDGNRVENKLTDPGIRAQRAIFLDGTLFITNSAFSIVTSGIGNGFILDHGTNGVLDVSILGTSSGASATVTTSSALGQWTLPGITQGLNWLLNTISTYPAYFEFPAANTATPLQTASDNGEVTYNSTSVVNGDSLTKGGWILKRGSSARQIYSNLQAVSGTLSLQLTASSSNENSDITFSGGTAVNVGGSFYDNNNQANGHGLFLALGKTSATEDNICYFGHDGNTSHTKYFFWNGIVRATSSMDRALGWHTWSIYHTNGISSYLINGTTIGTGTVSAVTITNFGIYVGGTDINWVDDILLTSSSLINTQSIIIPAVPSGSDRFVNYSGQLTPISYGGNVASILNLINTTTPTVTFTSRTFGAFTHSNTYYTNLSMDVTLSNTLALMDDGTNQFRNYLMNSTSAPPSYAAYATSSVTISSTTWSAVTGELTRTSVSFKVLNPGNEVRWLSILPVTANIGVTINATAVLNSSSSGQLFLYGETPPLEKTNFFSILHDAGIKLAR